jgi:AP-1 complex subunit gamma-1
MVEDFVDRVVTLLKDKNHGVIITVVQLMTQVLMIDYQNAIQEGENPFETDCRKAFLRLVPMLVKMLRNLLSSGYSPEYEIAGISDPFLQVQLLTLLRLLGAKNEKASEEMNDVLAQVATNTDSSKNAGNAILYECVQAIMGIESEDGLQVLAVNILGRFLLNRDNNIRYVALNTLSRTIEQQGQARAADGNSASQALQKHRGTVVDCLKDPDISIRQRALELIYHLVNQENVQSLTAELLNYLVLCPREHRSDICTRVLRVVDRFSPDDRWRVDTLITMLTIAGREARSEVQNATVIYISRAAEDVHAYATHKLLKAIRDDDGSQRGLLNVGIWCIGEYGDLLLTSYTYTPTPAAGEVANGVPVSITFMALDPLSVIGVVESVIARHSCPEPVKHRALTCFAKLSARFADKGGAAVLDRLQKLVQKNQSSLSLEMQLRSCEYNALLDAAKGLRPPPKAAAEDDLFGVTEATGTPVGETVITAAKEALSRMPVADIKLIQKRQEEEFAKTLGSGTPAVKGTSAVAAAPGGDLLDIFASDPVPTFPQNGAPAAGAEKSDLDLLSEIFAASAPTNVPAPVPVSGGFDPFAGMPAAPPVVVPSLSNPLDIFGASLAPVPAIPAAGNPLDIFGGPIPLQTVPAFGAQTAPAFGAQTAPAFGAPALQGTLNGGTAVPGPLIVPGFTHNHLTIEFECTKPDTWNKGASVLIARCKNSGPDAMYGFNLQCAVPKYVSMEMEPPSSTTIPVSIGNAKPVTQKIKVSNSMLGTKSLMLKLKVSFTLQGTKTEHMATCSGFPVGEY